MTSGLNTFVSKPCFEIGPPARRILVVFNFVEKHMDLRVKVIEIMHQDASGIAAAWGSEFILAVMGENDVLAMPSELALGTVGRFSRRPPALLLDHDHRLCDMPDNCPSSCTDRSIEAQFPALAMSCRKHAGQHKIQTQHRIARNHQTCEVRERLACARVSPPMYAWCMVAAAGALRKSVISASSAKNPESTPQGWDL